MTLHDIWLHHYDGDFAEGVQLLKTHQATGLPRQIMTRLNTVAFSGGTPSAYEQGKLAAALHKVKIEGDYKAPETITPGTNGPTRETIPAKSKTTDRAKALHKEHGHEHTLMATADNDEARAKHAAKIMEDIVPALDSEYGNGKDINVGTISDEADDSAAKLRELQSLRSRISKIRNKLLPQCKDMKRKAKLETELKEKLEQKEVLESLLT